MPQSINKDFIDLCKYANDAIEEVYKFYNFAEFGLDKAELRKDEKTMNFLNEHVYDIYKELSEPLYGNGKKNKTPSKKRKGRKYTMKRKIHIKKYY